MIERIGAMQNFRMNLIIKIFAIKVVRIFVQDLHLIEQL